MDVSIVIVCWNGRDLLKKNLPTVIKSSHNSKNQIREILVIDDGSTDDSVVFLKENYPQIKLVEHKKNFGYAAGCNTGVKEAIGDLVVILNLDVAPSADFLEHALPHFEDKKVFAVSFNEGKFGPGKLEWQDGFLQIIPTQVVNQTSLTDWPSGGSSIFKKEIWQKLGGMDNLFLPFYFEDMDLGIRARKGGYQCLWEPKSEVIHHHEASINPQNFSQEYIDSIKQRNHLLLTWKNLDSKKILIRHFFGLLKRILKHPRYLKVVFEAVDRVFFYKKERF